MYSEDGQLQQAMQLLEQAVEVYNTTLCEERPAEPTSMVILPALRKSALNRANGASTTEREISLSIFDRLENGIGESVRSASEKLTLRIAPI